MLEVRMDILKAVADGYRKPTLIMYRSNTSWMILKRDLVLLKTSGFIQESLDRSKPVYAITFKGIAVLRDYRKLVDETIAANRGIFS